MRTLFVVLLGIVFVVSVAYARDPFASVLPKVQKNANTAAGDAYTQAMTQQQPGAGAASQAAQLTFVVQGVFWDTANPRVIIDGDVYKIQDVIKGTDNARIVQIKKNSIVVLYNGSMIVKKPEQNI